MSQRQVILANKVLPPFEIVECPEFITIKMKAGDDVFNVNVPIKKFETTEEYIKYIKEDTATVEYSVLVAAAERVDLMTPEQIKELQTKYDNGEIK